MSAPAVEPATGMRGHAQRESVAADLAARARRGTHAMLATRILSVLGTAASVAVLPRLIAPSDFGVWAMAGLALGVMTIVREMGLVPALVQARSLSRAEQDGYFRASLAVSLAAAALLALAAPLLADFYNAPLLAPVLWACCACLVVNGGALVHLALLRRELHFGKVALVEGGGIVSSLAVQLVCAYLWRDIWALVAGYITSAVWMSSAAVILHPWKPSAAGRRQVDLSFSFQVTLYNLLAHVGNNAGLLAGYRFTAAELGFFNRAQQLCFLTIFAFLVPVTEAAFSLLCRLKHPDAYRRAYVAMARRVWLLFIPYTAVLPVVADDLIVCLLGSRWAEAGPVLAWFSPAIVGLALASLFEQLMLSQGRGKELGAWAAADLALRAGGAFLGSRLGIVGLAGGFALATCLTVPLMLWIAGRRGPVQLRHQLAALWPGLPLGAAALGAALLAASEARALGLSGGWARLLLVGGSALGTWALLCLVVPPARQALLGIEAESRCSAR